MKTTWKSNKMPNNISTGSVVFFNGFMNTVVGTHGIWVKIKNLKGKTQWVDSNLMVWS